MIIIKSLVSNIFPIVLLNYNQITSFKHLPNIGTLVYCYNNQITNIKDLLYIPNFFLSDINVTPDQLYKNRIIHGLTKINKVFKNKQSTIIQKNWQKYWYNDLIDVEGTQMNRFGYYCWTQM